MYDKGQVQSLYWPAFFEASIKASVGRVPVPYHTHTTTGDYAPIPQPQPPIVPIDKLSISPVPHGPVAVPFFRSQ